MTTSRPDDIIRRYLVDRASDGPPPDLLARTLSRTAAARQKPWWWTAPRLSVRGRPLSQRTIRLVSVGLVVIGLLGAFALGGAFAGGPADRIPPTAPPTSSPSEGGGPRVDSFIRPFEWTPMDPAAPDRILPSLGVMGPEIYQWLDAAGSKHAGGRNTSQVAGEYGVAIASAGEMYLVGCAGLNNLVRDVGRSPANLLADLQSVGGIGLGPQQPGTLDGWPALVADLEPAENLPCAADIRTTQGLSYDSLSVALPSRLIVADVDGATVVVQIWARTGDELAAWLPDANRFVEGIRFDAKVGPQGSGAPQHIPTFNVPFEYTPIAGGQIGLAVHSLAREVVHWVDDPLAADADGHRNGAQRIGEYGVALVWVDRPTIDHCGTADASNLSLSRDPAKLVAELRDFGRVGLGPDRPSTLDGWPALVADLDPAANRTGCADKIRLNSVIEFGDYLALTLPSRFIVANVDGQAVIVQIWARTPEALAEWLPAASRFVEDIHFLK